MCEPHMQALTKQLGAAQVAMEGLGAQVMQQVR